MKTRRQFMTARFVEERENAKNLSGEKETIGRILIIDKKTETHAVDARFYMGASRNASTVYCSIWVKVSAKKKPGAWESVYTSGRGAAGGYGYHKQSAALQDAINSAGIELYGSPYNRADDHKKSNRAYIGGCGDNAMRDACLAIAYAAGFTDCIVIE